MSTDNIYILIGGNGFIGRNLLRFLPSEKVVIIGRSLPVGALKHDRYFSIQQHSLDEIAREFKGHGNYVIIDLSYISISNTSPINPGRDISENLNLVIDNLKFAASLSALRYVYISSGGTVYGKTTETKISEIHPTNPVSHYGIIKLAAEKYIQMFCSQNGRKYLILRPSNVYGPGQIPYRGQGFISTALASAFNKSEITVFGDGNNIRDYIYVDDFCKWLIEIVLNGEDGEIYNAGSGNGFTINKILEEIRKVMGDHAELKLKHVSSRPFDVKSNILENSKIVAATNINCAVGLHEGVALTWNWIQKYAGAS